MITGTVSADREAVIPLAVRGASGQDVQILAVIDTGFNGFLTLPLHLVAVLGLTRLSRGRAQLADGRETIFDIYSSTVHWDGHLREVETNALPSAPLVGMSLLHGSELYVHAVEGGQVRITGAAEA